MQLYALSQFKIKLKWKREKTGFKKFAHLSIDDYNYFEMCHQSVMYMNLYFHSTNVFHVHQLTEDTFS